MFKTSRRSAIRSAVAAVVLGLGVTFSGSAAQAETLLYMCSRQPERKAAQ
jgi:hypothetical protein